VIEGEINKLVSSWGTIPILINDGRCEEFAMNIIDSLGGYSGELYELSTGNFDPEWKTDLPGHVWVFYKGRHYDAEAPQGVENWRELPIFKQFAYVRGL